MSDKGGSDLGVFDGLADKKASTAPERPNPSNGPSALGARPQRTLLGMNAPAPSVTGNAPPPPPLPSSSTAPPPPPAAGRQTNSGGQPAQARTVPPPWPGPNAGNRSGSFPSQTATMRPPAGPPPSVEMDWDDEDEKTTVYDKGGNEDAAKALLATTGATYPPAPAAGVPAPSIPPPMRPSLPAPPPTRPINRPPTPSGLPLPPVSSLPPPNFRSGPDRSIWLYAAIFGLLVAAGVAVFVFFIPKAASLVVTVSGPGNKPLDSVQVFLNGELKCSVSPCDIPNLKPDSYTLRAQAAGHQPMADTAIKLTSGEKAVQNLTLVRALGTGIKVIAEGSGLKLWVDGQEVGPLPQELKDMDPGNHVIRVAGSDRYEPWEKDVHVESEQMQTIGPLKLEVLKGLATIVPGANAEGASVLLVSGKDRRTLPKLPINLDIPTDRDHTIVASKPGFETLQIPIEFDNGEAEKTFEIKLKESSFVAPPSNPAPPRTTPAPRAPAARAPAPSPAPAAPAPAPASQGMGTLNINSIPVSKVILDGRPLGATPKIGIRVSPGRHNVVFVKGSERKISSVEVTAGGHETVAVRF